MPTLARPASVRHAPRHRRLVPSRITDNAGATERLSAMFISSPWRGVMRVPIGADTAAHRAPGDYLYSGISGAGGSMAVISLYYHLVGGVR